MRKITRAQVAHRHVEALLQLLHAARKYSRMAETSSPGFYEHDKAVLELLQAATSYARSFRP